MYELVRQNKKNPSLNQGSDDIRRKYQSYANKFLQTLPD
jgi:hypothetical protein